MPAAGQMMPNWPARPARDVPLPVPRAPHLFTAARKGSGSAGASLHAMERCRNKGSATLPVLNSQQMGAPPLQHLPAGPQAAAGFRARPPRNSHGAHALTSVQGVSLLKGRPWGSMLLELAKGGQQLWAMGSGQGQGRAPVPQQCSERCHLLPCGLLHALVMSGHAKGCIMANLTRVLMTSRRSMRWLGRLGGSFTCYTKAVCPFLHIVMSRLACRKRLEIRTLPTDDGLVAVEFPLYRKYQILHHGEDPAEVSLTPFTQGCAL